MVLTAAQTSSFFENADQMGVQHATVVQLALEGIQTVDDLADFDKEVLQQLADNLRRPGGRVPNPDPGAAAGSTIPTPAFVFGAKSQKRLGIACELVRYYNTVSRDLTAANMRWNNVIKNFEIQWKALKIKRDEDTPDVPKISKALPIIKWTEAFQDHLHRVIGVRMIPLAYVTRQDEDVPAVAPPLMAGQPHSELHGSIEGEMIARASHTHTMFRDDNAAVYYALEEATRSTSYSASIKPFQRTKNGRGALQALTNQYAGNDKWEAEIRRQDDLLHTRVWKGQSSFPLEGFIAQHRNAFVSMQQCAKHIAYQLPNEHTRVGCLLEGIQCSDPGLQAAMASVRTDDGPNGMRNDFEKAAAHLLPYDPVARKRAAGTKRPAANISDARGMHGPNASAIEISDSTSKDGKVSIGKTGVHLRYHTNSEYRELSTSQKKELSEWREKDSEKKKKPRTEKQKAKSREISAAVTKALTDMMKPKQDSDPTNNIVSGLLKAAMAGTDAKKQNGEVSAVNNSSSETKRPPIALKSILRHARNGST